MSAGRISAASTSPSRTFWTASSSVFTRTTSIASNSGRASSFTSTVSPPRLIWRWLGGTSLSSATRGLLGPLVTANPTSAASRIGYSTSIATSSGDRRRICRSLISSQRIAPGLVTVLVQERHERRLEVRRVILGVLDGALEVARRAAEEELAVGEDHDLGAVALGLLDHVGRE